VGCPRPDEFLARRIRDPIGNIVDNGEYDILHPGAMIYDRCLSRLPAWAAWRQSHPSAGYKDIGQVIMEILPTDVALVKLQRIRCPYRGEYCSTISMNSLLLQRTSI
jgi:hypothetical protein